MSKNDKNEKAEAAPAAEPTTTVPVLVQLDRTELERVKEETGARANATAVACFVRKNLKG